MKSDVRAGSEATTSARHRRGVNGGKWYFRRSVTMFREPGHRSVDAATRSEGFLLACACRPRGRFTTLFTLLVWLMFAARAGAQTPTEPPCTGANVLVHAASGSE